VVEDVHVEVADESGTIAIVLAESTPTTELRLDGTARTVTGTLNYGALNVSGPLAAFAGEETYDEAGNPVPQTYTGDIDIVVGGLNGSLTFDGSTDVLEFKDIGLGDVSTTAKFDGDTIFSLDVNPEDGRRFDVRVAKGEGETAVLTFSPTLDVRVLLDFAKIASQVEDIDVSLLNDQLHLWFDGANPSVEVGGENVKVVSGTLHIESGEHPDASLSVEPGMCLVDAAESETEPVSLAAALTAGVCE
jgi:hypothetical protein